LPERERKIRLVVEYDGSSFTGWQKGSFSPGGGPGRSVEGALEGALRGTTGEEARLVCAGRTDTGVHALGQVACFVTRSTIPPERFAHALNSRLPPDVTVLSSEEVPVAFHPRRDARSKLYRYVILNRGMRPALDRARVAHVRAPLDAARMREAACLLVGRHDFTSFAAAEATAKRSPVREITRLDVARRGERVVIEVEGPGFLMHMVRTIAGSLIEVGRGGREPGWIGEVLEARDRRLAGPTAPPGGLALVRVEYGG
jgi:tRNA pseudouridine38-40 synthase